MTEDELLAAATIFGLRCDRLLARRLLDEVERLREAAQRVRDLPVDREMPPWEETRER
ncbi:MAG TPA: hypothetical protein VNN19_03855 [bacterium]|nr:hypothetical protein [bacterium]